jgi:hypothetical protein
MGDTWIDARQEYEGIDGSSTTITNISNDDLLTPPPVGDANYLIRLVNELPSNVLNLYVIQANENGEIRFLTKNAYLNNDVSAQDGNLYYNVKIGSNGKLYCYWTYNALVNPIRFSGWYDVMEDIVGQGAQLTLLEGGLTGLELQLITAQTNITTLFTNVGLLNEEIIQINIELGALGTQSLVFEDLFREIQRTFYSIRSKALTGRFSRLNWKNAVEVLRSRFNVRQQAGRIGNVMSPARTLTRTQLNAFQMVSSQGGLAINKAVNDVGLTLGIIGGGVILGGIYKYYANAEEETKKDLISDLIETKEDMILQQANTPNSFYTTANVIATPSLSINTGTQGNYTGEIGFYEVSLATSPNNSTNGYIAMEIYLQSSVKTARISKVEHSGERLWAVGDTITIDKQIDLGGWDGTGTRYLLLNVNTVYSPLEAMDLIINSVLAEQPIDDRRNRRRQGVIGVNEYDTGTFTNTTATETNTDTGEVITYPVLKSRLNLLPTGTSDVDVYTSTGKIGIGTTPAPYTPLHIYHATDSTIQIQSGTSGKSSIQFVRGIEADILMDYRLVNDNNLFRLQFQRLPTQFGDSDSYIMDIDQFKTNIYTDLQVKGFVGIGTTPSTDEDLYQPQCKIWSNGNTSLLLRGQNTTGSSSIEFSLGDRFDSSPDFRIVSNSIGDKGLLFQFQDNIDSYGDAGTNMLILKPTGTIFYTSLSINENVGIGTQYDLTGVDRLRINGNTKITTGSLWITDGSVGIGTTEPNTKLHIQTTTADTRLTIEDMNETAYGLPTDIVFPDGGYTSTVVGGATTTDKTAYLDNQAITTNQRIRFTLIQRMEVDLLMVGGGGAGGHNNGGGGGAGGIFYGKNFILEAGNYVMVVGRGGIGQSGETTIRLSTADGQPTYLCYDDGLDTPVKVSLGGVIQQTIAYGGGSGATSVAGNATSLAGWLGGSGGGASEGIVNSYAVNAGGATIQPQTFWNGTSYVIGGRTGRNNTITTNDLRGGGGGGGTASSTAETTDYTCGRNAISINFYPTGSPYILGAGGGSAISSATNDNTTTGLGGLGSGTNTLGGNGFYRFNTTTIRGASAGTNDTGSGGGGSGAGGVFTTAGDGGTGVALIRYRLAERKNSCSLDLFRNNSSLIGYSVGNYEGQFKIQRENFATPSILVNPLGRVSIGSKYTSQVFQVGNKGGRLRIANDDTDFTQIGANDEVPPCIRIFGSLRTDGTQGDIVYFSGAVGGHHFVCNNIERLTLLNNGRVGIGTTNPASIFQIGSGARLKIANDNTGYTTIGTNDTDGADNTQIILAGSALASGGNIDYVATSTGSHRFFTGTGTTERMRIKTNGYVGIGNNNPDNILQVGAGGRLRIANGNTDYTLLGTEDALTITNACLAISGSSRTGGFAGSLEYIARSSTGRHSFYGGATTAEIMRLSATGNLAIGSINTDDYKLRVNGNTYVNGQLVFNNDLRPTQTNYACNKISLYGGDTLPASTSTYGIGVALNALEFFSFGGYKFYSATTGGTGLGSVLVDASDTNFAVATSIQSSSWLRGNGAGGVYRLTSVDTYVRLRDASDTALRNFAAQTISASSDLGGSFVSTSSTSRDLLAVSGNATQSGNRLAGFILSVLNSMTGFHRCYVDDDIYDENDPDIFKKKYMGRVVIASGKIKTDFTKDIETAEGEPIKTEWYSKTGKDGIAIEDAIPMVALSRKKKDKRVFGVLGDPTRNGNNKGRMIVNSIGEGAICVSNTNGNIENGDLLQSSDLLGYGEKQDDDIIRNYTIGKATMDCNFELDNPNYQCHEIEGGVRVAFIACVYHCG